MECIFPFMVRVANNLVVSRGTQHMGHGRVDYRTRHKKKKKKRSKARQLCINSLDEKEFSKNRSN